MTTEYRALANQIRNADKVLRLHQQGFPVRIIALRTGFPEALILQLINNVYGETNVANS